MSITAKIGVVIDGEFVSKEEIKSMNMEQFKMLAAFLDEKEISKVAKWHSETAEQYVECILNSCQFSY